MRLHPPYWDIIQYSDAPGDLSHAEDYEELPKAADGLPEAVLRRARAPGGRLVVLIGDVRRQGRYTAIIKDVLNFPHGEIRSAIIKVQHNCTSDRKSYGKMEDVPIRHEYCVVWRKTAMATHKDVAVASLESPAVESVRHPHAKVVVQ